MNREHLLRIGRRVALGLLVLVLLYAAAGFLLLPWLAQRHVPPALAQMLGRAVTVDEFRANPFLLTFHADGVRVAGEHGAPLLAIGELVADASLRGVLQGTWTLDRVSVQGLQVHLAVRPDGSLDLPRVQGTSNEPAAAEKQPAAADGPPAVRIGELAVPDARIVLLEPGTAARTALEVAPLDLQAQGLSTVAGDPPASYELHAALADTGSVQLRGRAGLQDGAIAGSGQLQASGLPLGRLLALFAPGLPVSGLQAQLRVSAAYAHGPAGLGPISDIAASAGDVQVTLAGDGQPLLQAAQLSLEGGRVDLRRRQATAAKLRLADGRIRIAPQAPARDAAPQKAADANAGGWNVQVDRLELAQVGVGYTPGAAGADVRVDAVDGHAHVELATGDGGLQVAVTGADAKVQGAFVGAEGAEPSLRLASADLTAGHLDTRRRALGAERLALAGSATLVRNRQGEFVWPSFGTSGAAQPQQPPWRYGLDKLEVRSLDLALHDRSIAPDLQLRGTLQGTAQDLSSDGTASFDAKGQLAGGARVTAAGTVAVPTGRLQAKVGVQGLPLRPFQPLLAGVAPLVIRSGVASGSGQLRYAADAGLAFDGDAALEDLLVAEAASGDRFLSCKRLQLRGGSFDAAARRFTARTVDVQGPGAKIVVSENRHLNLLQVFDTGAADAARGTRQAAGQPNEGTARAAPASFAYDIGEIRLHGGEIDFADHSLVLPFSTRVTGVEGTLAGVSGDPSRSAAIELQGSIQPYGAARVSGSFVPAAPTRSTDLHAEFENVPVPPLSPYTATFAGRKVESGKLWLDLRYRVQDGELRGSNDIRLRDFTLGARVEAPSALDVPLDLAVALLSDGDGQIRLSVPVTGEVGDAHFSVASAVKQAIGNVLQRIASAPFRALGRLFGGGDDESLAAVGFEAGSARLQAQARERLDALARAMRERPQLALVVPAPYDPRTDEHAIRREHARRQVAAGLGRDVAPGEDPGAISFDDPETQRVLERLLVAQAGRDALRELQAAHPKGDGLYEAMFGRLAAAQPVPDRAAQVLAVDRARRIADYLRERGVDGSRVRTGTLATVPAGRDGEIAAQLQVAAGAAAPG